MSTLLEPEKTTGASTVEPRPRRRRRRALLVTCAVLAPVAAFTAAYAAFFTPTSVSRLALSTPGRPQAEPGVDHWLGTWTVAPGSVAGYRVREKLLRLPAPNDAVGRTEAVRGSFELRRDGREYLVTAGMRVDIDVASLKSDEQRRDDHMRTMAIETDRFPTATFVTDKDLLVPQAVVGAGAGHMTATGNLTLHGVTRAVAIPVDVQRNGGQIEVVGSLVFDWELFDIQRPNLSYVTVEDRPTLEFRLLFSQEDANGAQGAQHD